MYTGLSVFVLGIGGLYLCLRGSAVASKELWALRGWGSSSEWSLGGTPLEERWLALMLADLVWPRVGLVPSPRLCTKLISKLPSLMFHDLILFFYIIKKY